VLGRYALCEVIGSGGMAAVHLGRLLGPVGFSRVVAIKRMHHHLATDTDFAAMFLDEARLAARIQHANVVATLDVVAEGSELFQVMEYVDGDSLAKLLRKLGKKGARVPSPVIGSIVSQALYGLHAAHEARDDEGRALGLIHRDVSPDNLLIGRDGVARVLDFGVAKATELSRTRATGSGLVKGKIAYMAPEQIRNEALDRRVDLYAMGATLWEVLVGERMNAASSDTATFYKVMNERPQPPGNFVTGLPSGADAVVMTAVAYERDARFATAREMAIEVERVFGVASPSTIAGLLESLFSAEFTERTRTVESMKQRTSGLEPGQERAQDHRRAAVSPSPGEEANAARARGEPTLVSPVVFEAPREVRPTESIAAEPGRASIPSLTPAVASGALSLPPQPAPPAAVSFDVSTSSPGTRVSAGIAPRTEQPSLAPTVPMHFDVDFGAVGLSRGPSIDGQARHDEPSRPEHAERAGRGGASAMRGQAAPTDEPPPSSQEAANLRAVRKLEGFVVPGAIVGALIVAAIAGIAFMRRGPAPAPTPTASPWSVSPEAKVSCERMRKRLIEGGKPVGLSRDGWVVELWLRGKQGAPIDATSLDLLDLAGADPKSSTEVAALRVPGHHVGEGILVRVRGPGAEAVFAPDGATRLAKAAERAMAATGAEAGGLWARCEHLPHHDLGFWFRGKDLTSSLSALLVGVGSFAETRVVRPGAFEGGKSPTIFERTRDLLGTKASEPLIAALQRYDVTVGSEPSGAVRLSFPAEGYNAALRSSRLVADHIGVEDR